MTVYLFDDELCLRVDPFEGSFGKTTDTRLKDKIAIARKSGPCSMCGSEIQPKEKIRIAAYIIDGELHSYRWCSACCAAMVKSWSDNGEEYEKRIAHQGDP